MMKHEDGSESHAYQHELKKAMTLEEAIEHSEEKAMGQDQCSLEHRQLAEWLKELKRLRKNT